MTKSHLPLLCSLLFGALATSAQAGHPVVALDGKDSKTVAIDDSPFVAGKTEIEIDAAISHSVGTPGTAERPNVGLAIAEIRVGRMITTPSGGGILRGNLEVMLEAFGGGITEGPGNGLVGGDLLIRYNFVQPQAKLVPYLQIGGGGVYSDMANVDGTQRLIGSPWSFSLESEIGLRYMISRTWSIDLGFEYRHISNAGTASRNRGLNALGGALGVSTYF